MRQDFKENVVLNNFYNCLQWIFSHSHKRKMQFNFITSVILLKFRIETRWGTKLKFAVFVSDNSQAILHYFDVVKMDLTLPQQAYEITRNPDFIKVLYCLELFKNVSFILTFWNLITSKFL